MRVNPPRAAAGVLLERKKEKGKRKKHAAFLLTFAFCLLAFTFCLSLHLGISGLLNAHRKGILPTPLRSQKPADGGLARGGIFIDAQASRFSRR
jgi:hypothetical protein